MRKCLFFIVASFVSLAARADFGIIECESNSIVRSVKLSLDETSDVSAQTVALSVNGKATKVSAVGVTRSEYGILAIDVQVGTGPAKYKYAFKNLGSNKCFGVYGSKQKGWAWVEVINSIGKKAKLNCQCDQD